MLERYAPAPRARTPVAVGDIRLDLLDRPVGRGPLRRRLYYRVQIVYSDGQHTERGGRLEDLLRGETLNRLGEVLDASRLDAAQRLIPGRRRNGGGRPAPHGEVQTWPAP